MVHVVGALGDAEVVIIPEFVDAVGVEVVVEVIVKYLMFQVKLV